MTIELNELMGMTSELERKLKEIGINDSGDLLDAATTPKQRQVLSQQMAVPTRDVLELANRADLARIKGIGSVYSDLLEKVGVDTVKELATRRSDHLHQKILVTNEQVQLVKRPPTLAQVEQWVEEAKQLPKVLQY
ncbi:DUF4332 domain-containing protein [Methylohalobius crimeensis]|uniref:DUF4332 domain-containing protein n=1 Tax=Methylohalobius crimeensis TaxID=244365 RepID=UPI0003B5BFFF|nr:DUF4332 domain-containing protein [Methylohalobius crimeensis]